MKTSIGPVVCCPGILFLTLLFSAATRLISAETDAAPAKPEDASLAEPASPTNAAGEIRLSQPVIDQLRREIEQSAARNAEAINAGLSLIEPTLARMHERQMEAVQSSNRSILMVVGVFAAVGFGGVIFISLILVRALGRFSELAVMTSPRGPFLGSGQSLAILGAGAAASGQGAVEQASGEFQNAIEQLQGRIRELEDSFQSTATEGSVPHATAVPPARSNVEPLASALSIQTLLSKPHPASGPSAEAAVPASRATLLLGKGQALFNLDAAEQALQCFEEALSLEPNNSEALVRKGMAQEKLQEWEQALESYNRAIDIDSSLTVAHLYRGGVCNRLQRYREALESYEQALRTEKKTALPTLETANLR